VASSGNVKDEVIMEYIESQEKETQKEDDFKICPWHGINLQPAYSRFHNVPRSAGSIIWRESVS
jgi:hypothetical protein